MSVSIATGVSSLDVLSSTGAAAVVGAAGGVYAAARMDDESSASENVTALNAALAESSVVNIWRPGTIYINAPLVIPSNTELVLGEQTEIKLTGGVPKPLIVTAARNKMAANEYIACTLAWVSGKAVTVTKAAHGLAVGDFVFMWSSTLAPSNYAGVFPVTSVTDANNFVIKLHRTPNAAPTGTAQYILADKDITIRGGRWNMNYPAVTGFGSDPLERYGMMLCGVANLRVIAPRIINCPKYLIYTCGLFNYRFTDVTGEGTASDAIKLYGPSVKGVVEGTAGVINDDGVSVQTKEPAAFLSYQLAWGDCHDIKIYDTNIESAANCVVVFPTADHYMGGIEVNGTSGIVAGSGVSINPGQASAVLDDMVIRNNRCSALYGVGLRNNALSGTVKHLTIEYGSQHPDDYTLDRAAIFSDTNVSVDVITVRGFHARNAAWPLTSGYALNFNGVVKHLYVDGGYVDFRNNTGSFCQFNAAVESVTCAGLNVSSNCATVFRIFAGTPTVNLLGNNFNNNAAIVSTNVATTVNISGNRINIGSQGVLRSNVAAVMKVNSGGNNWIAGSVYTNGSATGLWEFRGFDIPVDIGATGVQKTITGQFAYNTGTGRGTVVQNRLVTCNGTAWVQVDDATKTF